MYSFLVHNLGQSSEEIKMSLSCVEQIITRIKAATIESPIAVFRSPAIEEGRLDAIFASPVVSQERIKSDQANLIGIYNSGSDVPDMEGLRGHLNIQLSIPAV